MVRRTVANSLGLSYTFLRNPIRNPYKSINIELNNTEIRFEIH